jgi:hypothetical protein
MSLPQKSIIPVSPFPFLVPCAPDGSAVSAAPPNPVFAADLDCKRMAQDLVVFQRELSHVPKFRNVVFHFGPETLRPNVNAAASIE